jgi:aspartate-semialdehyde dehydrogenase
MQVSVGGITGTQTGMMYNCLAHNTIRGAAGASILNGELLLQAGYL